MKTLLKKHMQPSDFLESSRAKHTLPSRKKKKKEQLTVGSRASQSLTKMRMAIRLILNDNEKS